MWVEIIREKVATVLHRTVEGLDTGLDSIRSELVIIYLATISNLTVSFRFHNP